MRSVFIGGTRPAKQPPTIVTNKKYTLWSALRGDSIINVPPSNQQQPTTTSDNDNKKEKKDDTTISTTTSSVAPPSPPPFIDLATGNEVLPDEFKSQVAAICLLFLDLSEQCSNKNCKPICKDFLKRALIELEIPTRVIIVPMQQQKQGFVHKKLTQEEYEMILDDLPAGLALPNCEDPRAHILCSFREDFSANSMPCLAMFDAHGNKLNRNAFYEMFEDLNNSNNNNNNNPSSSSNLSNFPYRTGIVTDFIRLFRSEFVDPALVECPCIILHRLSTSAKDSENAAAIFNSSARKYREVRGETSPLKFYETRTLDQVTFTRKKDECRKGHALKKRGAFDETRCNGCGEAGRGMMGCTNTCGFELCEKCYEKEVQVPHPDVQLMSLLCDEFGRDAPQTLCILGFSYWTGNFFAERIGEDDDGLLSFFQRVDKV